LSTLKGGSGLERTNRKVKIGKVVNNKMDKTVVVAVDRITRHPLYGKIIRSTKKLKVHDSNNECRIGDKVKNHGNQTSEQRKKMASN
jgi:small subunit ribosomal protein S17